MTMKVWRALSIALGCALYVVAGAIWLTIQHIDQTSYLFGLILGLGIGLCFAGSALAHAITTQSR